MRVLQARLSFGNPDLEQSSVRTAPEAAIQSGSCALRRSRSYPPGDGKSIWNRVVTPPYCSICEHPVESRPRPGFYSMHTSAMRGVVRASYRLEKPIRLWSVSSPHENHRLSWPDRQTVRCAGDDTELEHHNGHRADFERRGQQGQAAIDVIGFRLWTAIGLRNEATDLCHLTLTKVSQVKEARWTNCRTRKLGHTFR